MEIVPLAHVDEAGALFASFYAQLDGLHESYRNTLSTPRSISPTEEAIAAVDDGRLIGFFAPVGARIRLEDHAATADRRAVYRELYEAFARRTDASRHQIAFLTVDSAGLQTFFELGFGVDQIRGIATLEGRFPDHSRDVVQVATTNDFEELTALAYELQTFHTGPPMFGDLLMDEAATREMVKADLARNGAVFKAIDGDHRIVGLTTVGAEGPLPKSARIGMQVVTADARGRGFGRALVLRALEWARDAGCDWCEVGWTSSNPTSDPFWRGLGFEPIRYTLSRKVR